jgi:hypothetical protein
MDRGVLLPNRKLTNQTSTSTKGKEMTFSRVVPAAFCMTLLGVAFAPSVKADDYDKKTTVTFSQPVEIPPVYITGMRVLPAGTYVFRLLNSSSNRHIVQIFNKEQNKIYATILAIPNYRLHATDKTVITFNEGLKDKPEAIRAWFYPGANWGEEFVYPKAKAVELAKVTKVPVLAVVTEVEVEVTKPEEPTVIAQLNDAPVMAVRPTGEVVEIAQVIQTAPAAAAEPTPVPVKQLPATASSLPMLEVFGLLALGGALTLRSIGKRAL